MRCTPGEFQTITSGSLQYYGDLKAHSKLVIGPMCIRVCVCVCVVEVISTTDCFLLGLILGLVA